MITPAQMELAFLIMFMIGIIWLALSEGRKRVLPKTSQE
jgi:cbb3-type cytochrome oxidase subunit 3